jgi:hypothetical protein
MASRLADNGGETGLALHEFRRKIQGRPGPINPVAKACPQVGDQAFLKNPGNDKVIISIPVLSYI